MFTNQEMLQVLYLQASIFCDTKRAKQGIDMWDTIDEVETAIMLENRAAKNTHALWAEKKLQAEILDL